VSALVFGSFFLLLVIQPLEDSILDPLRQRFYGSFFFKSELFATVASGVFFVPLCPVFFLFPPSSVFSCRNFRFDIAPFFSFF